MRDVGASDKSGGKTSLRQAIGSRSGVITPRCTEPGKPAVIIPAGYHHARPSKAFIASGRCNSDRLGPYLARSDRPGRPSYAPLPDINARVTALLRQVPCSAVTPRLEGSKLSLSGWALPGEPWNR